MTQEFARYHRQMLLPGIGEDGQRRLQNSTALILGCGALGTVSADMLARAGVGHLVIVDRDFIELTNLQRQVLFDERDVADTLPKAEAARRKLAAINSEVTVTAIVDDINHSNIERFAAGADIIIDGLDNFETRYLANDCAVKHGLPYLYGGAVGTAGMSLPILPHTSNGDADWEQVESGSLATPCFRCLFEEAPAPGTSPTCDTIGVLGPMVSVIANFQSAEAIKVLTGNYAQVARTMLNIDIWTNTIVQLKVNNAREQGNCLTCKQRSFEFLDGKAGSRSTSLCGRNAVQLTHRQNETRTNLEEMAHRLRTHGTVTVNEFMLRAAIRDNEQAYELTVFNDGRAIIKGTDDASVARSVYAKFIGN